MNILKEINFIIHGNHSKKHRKALLHKKYDMGNVPFHQGNI